jgi:hypothetical protein
MCHLKGPALANFVKGLKSLSWEDVCQKDEVRVIDDAEVIAGQVWGRKDVCRDFKQHVSNTFVLHSYVGTSIKNPDCRLVIGVHDKTYAAVGVPIPSPDRIHDLVAKKFNVETFPALDNVNVVLHPVKVSLTPPLVRVELDCDTTTEIGSILILIDGRGRVWHKDEQYFVVMEKAWAEEVQQDRVRQKFCKDGVTATFFTCKLFDEDGTDENEFEDRFVVEIIARPKHFGVSVTSSTEGEAPGLSSFGVWLRARGFDPPVAGLVEAFCGNLFAHVLMGRRTNKEVAEQYCRSRISWDELSAINVGRPNVAVLHLHDAYSFAINNSNEMRCLLVVPVKSDWSEVNSFCLYLSKQNVFVVDVIVDAPAANDGVAVAAVASQFDVPSLVFHSHPSFVESATAWYRGEIPVSLELIQHGFATLTEQGLRVLAFLECVARKNSHPRFVIVLIVKRICSSGMTTLLKQLAYELQRKEFVTSYIDKDVPDDSVWPAAGCFKIIFIDHFVGADEVVDRGRALSKGSVLIVRAFYETGKGILPQNAIVLDPHLSPNDVRTLCHRVKTLNFKMETKEAVDEGAKC